jgi:transcriptional regulator with XRE-family HTH domain
MSQVGRFSDVERTTQARLLIAAPHKEIAAVVGVQRETVTRWANGDWPIPAYRLFAVSQYQANWRYAQLLAERAGAILFPRTYIERPQPMFFLIANHAAVYARLLEISDKLKKGTLTKEERDEGRILIDQFRDFTEQIAVQIEGIEDTE